MTKAETFIEAWRLAAREEDFSLVDKIYHPDYSSFDYIAGVEVNLESVQRGIADRTQRVMDEMLK